jgi:hypothetical protein
LAERFLFLSKRTALIAAMTAMAAPIPRYKYIGDCGGGAATLTIWEWTVATPLASVTVRVTLYDPADEYV